MRRFSKRGDSTEIPRLEGGRTRHFTGAVCCRRWPRPRGDRTQFGRYQHDPGRVRARLPLDGRIVGVGRRQVLCAPRRPCRVRRRTRTIRSVEEHPLDSKMTPPSPSPIPSLIIAHLGRAWPGVRSLSL